MAYVRRLPSGSFNAVVRLPDGRRRSITDPLKRVVVAKANELEAQIAHGHAVHLRDRRVTVARWYTQWMSARTVESSTARKDESRWRNHIEPHWGGWPLESISRLDVASWVKKLTHDGVGPAAVHGSYQLLAVLLADAVDHGVIAGSPCRRITLPRRGRPEPRWFTRHEYDRLQLALANLTTVRGGRAEIPDPHAPVWQALVGLACFSGLRPGELAGLDVGAVDFDRRLVRVTQVVTRLEDGAGGHRLGLRLYPKSNRSVRSVPFPAEVGELLWRITADRTDGPVFTAPEGGRVQMEGNFRGRVWVRALKAAGIEPVRFYVCRHTAASWAVQAGVPDRQIMALLGHADTHLIATYAHLAPDQHDAIRAAWGEAPEILDPHMTHAGDDPRMTPLSFSTSEAREAAENGH